MHSLLITSLLLITPAALVAQDPARKQDPATQDPGAGDVEIMRRLLVEAVDRTGTDGTVLSPEAPTGPFGATDLSLTRGLTLQNVLSGGAVTHSRGFRAPGVGALFTLDVSVPAIVAQQEPAGEEDPAAKDDDWERVKRELETGRKETDESNPLLGSFHRRSGFLTTTFRDVEQLRWKLDPARIEATIDAVVKTLASHGSRIRDLDDDDPITVALHLTPSSMSTSPYTISLGSNQAAPQDATTWSNWVNVYGASNAPAQRVVVQVSLAQLRSINGGGSEALARSASIHRY